MGIAMRVIRRTTTVEAIRLAHPTIVEAPAGDFRGRPGDWLVVTSDGEQLVVRDEDFRKWYQVTSPAEETLLWRLRRMLHTAFQVAVTFWGEQDTKVQRLADLLLSQEPQRAIQRVKQRFHQHFTALLGSSEAATQALSRLERETPDTLLVFVLDDLAGHYDDEDARRVAEMVVST